jgi:hypothetical protein
MNENISDSREDSDFNKFSVLSESSSETAGDERYRKFILHFSLLPWST